VERRGIVWCGLMAVLVGLAYVVPYTVLSGVDAWYGAFLFWTLFAVAAIAGILLVAAGWRD
jgi:hypothetical protein